MAVVVGTVDADSLVGTLAADTITGGGGDDTVSGDQGRDTADFSGNAADYRIGWVAGEYVVTDTNPDDGDDGTDVLTGIETLRFADRDYSLPPVGEFRTTVTTFKDQSHPDVAVLADGSIVTVWDSYSDSGSGVTGVGAQRYDADGIPAGNEFTVNSTTPRAQEDASIAALADGGFVICWESPDSDLTGSRKGIFAQRYDAAGARQGDEFQVNTTIAGVQDEPVVAGLEGGGFVVSWISSNQDGSGSGIYAQRFDASGLAQGGEFRVNTQTSDDQTDPAISALASGGFVISWTSDAQDGSETGVYAQRFDAGGASVGGEYLVNTTTDGLQGFSDVTELGNGDLVFCWTSTSAVGEPGGIFARRFDADGNALSSEFRVDSTTSSSQGDPAVTALAGGGFVVTWASDPQDGSGADIFARIYTSGGVAVGDEFRINSTTADDQTDPVVDATDDGGFIVVWTSKGQDGSLEGIFAQRFTANGGPVAPSVHGGSGDDYLDLSGGALSGSGHGGNDTIVGGDSDDALDGGAGADSLVGGAGDDTYVVDDALDTIVEVVNGGVDAVRSDIDWNLSGGLENLVLTGSDAIDGRGNALKNEILGNSAANGLYGSGGNDTLIGGGSDDLLFGGGGKDSILGGSGNDILRGKAAVDTLSGGVGADSLYGGAGRDVLTGGDGRDVLAGGDANDKLTGGSGRDTFVFDSQLDAVSNVDRIKDFTHLEDSIQLDDDVFTAFNATVSTTVLDANFQQGAGVTTAQDADDRIIYDTSTGKLYYDADGVGGTAAVQFAVVGTNSHPTITAEDFVIVG
jgi:Ca2+-binding RTX toxin-like protein